MAASRNRSAEARAAGGQLLSIQLTGDGLGLLTEVRAALVEQLGRCSQSQAVEFGLREAAKKLRKKTEKEQTRT